MEFKKQFCPIVCSSTECPFYGTCAELMTEVVHANSTSSIDILFIGQGAGEKEHLTHRPFTGPAGKVLRQKLLPILVNNRLNIALDNTIRSRPIDERGKNRPPTKAEVAYCLPYLWNRIADLKPKVTVTLGASATGDIVDSLYNVPISKSRGKVYTVSGYTIVPTYHPAALLHSNDENQIREYHEKIDYDFGIVLRLL